MTKDIPVDTESLKPIDSDVNTGGTSSLLTPEKDDLLQIVDKLITGFKKLYEMEDDTDKCIKISNIIDDLVSYRKEKENSN